MKDFLLDFAKSDDLTATLMTRVQFYPEIMTGPDVFPPFLFTVDISLPDHLLTLVVIRQRKIERRLPTIGRRLTQATTSTLTRNS